MTNPSPAAGDKPPRGITSGALQRRIQRRSAHNSPKLDYNKVRRNGLNVTKLLQNHRPGNNVQRLSEFKGQG